MEFAFLEAFCCALELLNVVGVTADAFAWSKSRANRTARTVAINHGDVPPPRDWWSIAVIVLTTICVLLAVTSLIRWWLWFTR